MKQITVGENQEGMKSDALEMMQHYYRAADFNAIAGQLIAAKRNLEKAEQWRIRARSHGANV